MTARELMSGERQGVVASLIRGALSVVEPIYAGAMLLRNASFDAGLRAHRLPRPVISVGNITTGGTGKTPVVMWLAKQLQARGMHPAVLMRGYRATGSGNDEQQLMEDAKIFVKASANRVAAAHQLLAESPDVDVLLLDDGFQHRKVARDFDLVLINAAEPFGFGHVLPRGLLREPPAGLKRADAILLTHSDVADPEAQVRRFSSAPIYRCSHRHVSVRDGELDLPLDELRRRKYFAFAGVGDPGSLQRALEPVGARWFADHHAYTQADVDALNREAAASGAEVLVTTEKDWVKLRRLASPMKILRLSLAIEFGNDDGERLMQQIVSRITATARGTSAPPAPR
jgi:tetraacyldisaccharide 4'-kinase